MLHEVEEKLRRIKVLILDVDGVLTDGSIIYSDNGVEIKSFNVKDGLGIRLVQKAGIKIFIVTGRRSKALYRRCNDLGIKDIFDGVSDKAAVLDRILEQTGVSPKEIAFMGDDLPDLPLMKKVGLSIAVADAHETVKKEAAMITGLIGGAGAVREVCEIILHAQGHWEKLLQHFSIAVT